MPFDPIASGSRAPVDSPTCTNGIPRSLQVLRMYPIFFEFVVLVDAPLVVKSLITTPACCPSIFPNPTILPSRGVTSLSSSNAEAPSRPTSKKLPGSTSLSKRSCAFKSPDSRRFSSFRSPPIPAAALRLLSNSSINSLCFICFSPLIFDNMFFDRETFDRLLIKCWRIAGLQTDFSLAKWQRVLKQLVLVLQKSIELSLGPDKACSDCRFHPVINFAA